MKYNTSTLVRRYDLTYEGALSTTSKSRLASIQECAGATPDCFAPTTFTYQDGTSGLNVQVSTGASVPTSPLPMDVNGDGREDLVYSSSATSGSGTWMVMFANGTGYNTPTNTGITNTNYSGAIQIDYNGDGLKDLLVPYSGGTWWVMLSSASGLAAPLNTSAPATGTGGNADAFDINGDGLDDLIWADLVGYAGGDSIRYRLREPAGTFSSAATTLVGPLAVDQKMEGGIFGGYVPNSQRFPDFNGDGRGDFLYRRTTRTWNGETQQYTFNRAIIVHATGTWNTSVNTTANAAGDVSFGDFNGDGKTDILYLAQSGGLVARFSTGTGLTNAVTLGGGFDYWVVLDWDGDGFDDLLDSSGGNWQLRRSTGEGFASGVATGVASNGTTVTDLNGDGLFDLVNGATYRTRAGHYPDLLLTATDGFGNFATFSYASLANYGSYLKLTGAVFPMQEYNGPLYVVSNVAASNGIGGTYNLQSFYYQGARLHRAGPRLPRILVPVLDRQSRRHGPASQLSAGFPLHRRRDQRATHAGAKRHSHHGSRDNVLDSSVWLGIRDSLLAIRQHDHDVRARGGRYVQWRADTYDDAADSRRFRYRHAVRRHDDDDGARVGRQRRAARRFVCAARIQPGGVLLEHTEQLVYRTTGTNAAHQFAQPVRRRLDHAHNGHDLGHDGLPSDVERAGDGR